MSVREIRELLDRHALAPNRELGQNFLVDPAQADRLARLAGVEAGDAVIEVGTGLGILTRALAARGARITSLEVDAGLVRALRAEASLPAGVELVHADARRVDWRALAAEAAARAEPGSAVRVVANLPYSVATPLLRTLLDLRGALRDWSVMVQREVAERLVARPGTRDYGSLAVLHHLCVHAERETEVHPRCFYPVPRVSSSFVRIVPRDEPLLEPAELSVVERVVRPLFQQRRKTVGNTLRRAGFAERADAALAEAGIEATTRAEAIEPERLLALARALVASGGA